jgi:hypothetical protein
LYLQDIDGVAFSLSISLCAYVSISTQIHSKRDTKIRDYSPGGGVAGEAEKARAGWLRNPAAASNTTIAARVDASAARSA